MRTHRINDLTGAGAGDRRQGRDAIIDYRAGGTAMVVAGIDPEIRGGLVVVAIEDGAAPRLIEAIDIPIVGAGAKDGRAEVSLIALRRARL
jgi:hypothetical protein